MISLAVIVTTYNWPEALKHALHGLAQQTVLPNEIWVADDGSGEATARVIEETAQNTELRFHHIWHEDKGFRAAAIRNRAIRHLKSDYVIFLDGDCVPQPDFIANHSILAEAGYCVAGNRILLSQHATPRWLSDKNLWPQNSSDWIKARLKGDINRYAPLLRLPISGFAGRWRTIISQSWKGAKTCNLAFWKHDLLSLNGLDESYSGWGLEDSDLMIRALRQGIRRKDGRFATGVIHLWHRENDRSALVENQKRLEALLSENSVLAKIGLEQINTNDHTVKVY